MAPVPARASAKFHLVTLPDLAALLRAPTSALWRLRRAGLLEAETTADDSDEPLYTDAGFPRLRLLLDLLEGGASVTDLRAMATAWDEARLGSRTSKALIGLLEGVLCRVTERIERLKALREDLIRARDALHRCRSCHRTYEALPCAGCSALPRPLPRAVEHFFVRPRR